MNRIYLCVLVLVSILLSSSTGLRGQSIPLKLHSDTLISTAVEMINQDSLESYVEQLQGMGTRFLVAQNRKDVALWIKQKFESFGVAEVKLDSFLCYTNISYPYMNYDTTTWQYNVEARIEGSELPEEEVIVMGHYDCVITDDDPLLGAPGADDNASGTAAALETARVMMEMGYQPRRTTIFLPTAAEELMYFGDAGSRHYASQAAASGRNIVMVINNDMIAWDEDSWTIGVSNHIPSQHITDMAVYIIENYTDLNHHLWPASYNVGADLQSFLDEGYPGVYFMEEEFNPYYHTLNDVVDSCNLPYLKEVTKITCGLVLHNDLMVGMNENIPSYEDLVIYPNPVNDVLRIINTMDYQGGLLRISSTDGRVCLTVTVDGDPEIIDVSRLDPGIYIINIINRGEMTSKPLIINR